MTGAQVVVVAALTLGARWWLLRARVSTLTRRRDTADRQLNQTLRRWW